MAPFARPAGDAWSLARRDIFVGISAWTEPTLIASGTFYPPEVTTAEGRLRYAASRFPLLEVDATYYAPLRQQVAEQWVERTPEDSRFDVKAFRLLTHHPTPPAALWPDLRSLLPADRQAKPHVYSADVEPEFLEEALRRFAQSVEPLRAAGKLGAVLFQFPHYVYPSVRMHEYLRWLATRAPDLPLAIEFRQPRWVDGDHLDQTVGLLKECNIAYVCVDAPQGQRGSMPPLAVATADLSVVRFHGRNAQTWNQRGVDASARFAYDYSGEELAEWVPRVERLHRDGRPVHIVMNNCHNDFSVKAADLMARKILDGPRVTREGIERIHHLRERLAH